MVCFVALKIFYGFLLKKFEFFFQLNLFLENFSKGVWVKRGMYRLNLRKAKTY